MTRTIHIPNVGDVAVPDTAGHRSLTAQFYLRILQRYPQAQTEDIRRIVFRGDTRSHREIFHIGFFKRDYGEMISIGALVRGGISTSKDLRTVKQKYGHRGWYIYACYCRKGYDLEGVNSLEEVLALRIPPEDIVACAGPVVVDSGYWGTSVVREIVENRKSTVDERTKKTMLIELGKACRRRTVSEAPF